MNWNWQQILGSLTWATQAQMAELFNTTSQNITIHLKNIFKENELSQKSTCKEFLQVQKEGKIDSVLQSKLRNINKYAQES